MWWRIRGYITADARNQTEYGTVRGYIAIGLSTNTTGGDNAANQFDANRAFIQWAGFTFGRAQSFFDFFSQAALGYLGFTPNSDTGDGGKEVMAYTAQFGNGFSASISAEARRNTQIANIAVGQTATGAGVAPPCGVISGGSFSTTGSTVAGFGCYGGWQVPDIVGNLRVDQAWGSAQIGGALHEVNASYYGAGTATSAGALTPGVEGNGRPSDKWGYALMAGLRLNAPMIGVGDYIAMQVIYTQGALRYLYQNPGTGNMYLQNNQNTMFGVMSDGVYGGTVGTGTATEHQPDDGLGRKRRVRALLEPAVENVSLRRLRRDKLRLPSQCPPVHVLWYRSRHWTGYAGGGNPGLQHELEPVVDRFPDSMERDEGLLYGSRRRLHQVRERLVGRWYKRRYWRHEPEYLVVPGGHQHLPALHQQRGQLAGSVPRASRLLSLIA